MEADQRQELRAITSELAGWVDRADALGRRRAAIATAAEDAAAALRRGVVDIARGGTVDWHVLPLRSGDDRHLGDIARATLLPPIADDDVRAVDRLTVEVSAALRDVRSIVGARRFFSGAGKKAAGEGAANFLVAFREWGVPAGVPQLLERLDAQVDPVEVDGDPLADWVGLRPLVASLGIPEVVDGDYVAHLPGSVKTIERVLRDESQLRDRATQAGNAVRNREAAILIAEMPVERLKDATRERIRVGPLTDAGITTVQAVLDRGARLEALPGIGATTAMRMRGAAHTLWQTTYDEMPVRLDINERTSEATEVLRCLRRWDATRQTKGAAADLARAAALAPLAQALGPKVTRLVVFPGRSQVGGFRDAVDSVGRRAQLLNGARVESSPLGASADPWDDFLARPADYFAMLAELGFITEDEQKTHGDLPDEIVEAIRELELETEYLSASLRGYQSFGARFALVQRKVIIGDEMGLGKTVEALAVLAHLRATGIHHSLVICPAAVVTNWMREVAAKSSLRPHRLHGPERAVASRGWVRDGGVAVTTFETLAWLERGVPMPPDLGCIVVDEAHYIKNPEAQRTKRAARLLASCGRAILLTGTPLENRVEEFANLVGHLRPDLLVDASELAPRRFRRQVAPVYLRRNQEDVLTELPELVEVDEWLPMSKDDLTAYRHAVADGNFMAMRQAAMRGGIRSEKVKRLIEIVEEAEDNGRRVIVFSHFRDVLEEVVYALPGQVFGPLNGSVPAAARQVMIDEFSAAGHGAVLVAQIVAGGVGLNIQAASVVVICEPQLKPTTEWQAIARAHRMGQLQTVQVHRLLSEEGVDQRVTEILARKRELFEDFAQISDAALSAPEAFDVSEADLAREVVAAERERLFSAGPQSQDAVPMGALPRASDRNL